MYNIISLNDDQLVLDEIHYEIIRNFHLILALIGHEASFSSFQTLYPK